METVVDSTYKTKSGALNKARALQFCLEEDKNFLNDEVQKKKKKKNKKKLKKKLGLDCPP